MAKWSSAAADSYAEAMKRRYVGNTPEREQELREQSNFLQKRVDERRASIETKRPEIFAHDPDEPERLRRVFASWDFRNGT